MLKYPKSTECFYFHSDTIGLQIIPITPITPDKHHKDNSTVCKQTRDSMRSESPSDTVRHRTPAATATTAAACEKCIEVLKADCSSFGARELLSTAAEFVEWHATAVDSARILIFPECGCAFFEWSIIQ